MAKKTGNAAASTKDAAAQVGADTPSIKELIADYVAKAGTEINPEVLDLLTKATEQVTADANVIAGLKNELAEAMETIDEMDSMPSVAKGTIIITHDKKKYSVEGSVRHPESGEVITKEDLKDHPKVIATMIEKGSELLKPL